MTQRKHMVAGCRECPHPYEAHHDYLVVGSMLCWTRPEWTDRTEGYQSCDCPGYRPDLFDIVGERVVL